MKTLCCFGDCANEDRSIKLPHSIYEGAISLCSCRYKRLVQWRRYDGEFIPNPLGQNYDPLTGKIQSESEFFTAQFRQLARGVEYNENFETRSLPSDLSFSSEQVNKPSGQINFSVLPPPIFTGNFLIHRSIKGERICLWHLNLHEMLPIKCDSYLGLATAPVWNGCGIGFMCNPMEFHYNPLIPDWNIKEGIIFNLPNPIGRHAAPLLVMKRIRNTSKYKEICVLFLATQNGLALIDFYKLNMSYKEDVQFFNSWNYTDNDLYSPIFYRSGNSSYIVTLQHEGRMHWMKLNEHYLPVEVELTSLTLSSQCRFLPPVVTPEGICCIALTEKEWKITLIKNPVDDISKLSWVTPPWPLDMIHEEDFHWSPIVVKYQKDNRSISSDFHLIICGRRQMVVFNLRQYYFCLNAPKNVRILTPKNYGDGFHTLPAFVQSDGDNLVMMDIRTGKVKKFNLLNAQWHDLVVVPNYLKDQLISSPLVIDKHLILPTEKGLHKEPI